MEKIQTINEYVATEMGGKIEKRAKSPLLGLLLMVVGIALLVLMRKGGLSDSMQALTMTLGVLTLAVGVLLAAMCFSKALWHYIYMPTHSRMKSRKVYLAEVDFQKCCNAFDTKEFSALGKLQPVNTSNAAIEMVYSVDHAVALLQVGRYDTGHFEPETPVACLLGTEVAAIQLLCK